MIAECSTWTIMAWETYAFIMGAFMMWVIRRDRKKSDERK